MDSGEGRFIQFKAKDEEDLERKIENLRKLYPKARGVFNVGEILTIRGSKFKVKKIFGKIMTLQLQKAEDE